jgi:hypothetical protein
MNVRWNRVVALILAVVLLGVGLRYGSSMITAMKNFWDADLPSRRDLRTLAALALAGLVLLALVKILINSRKRP